MFWTCQRFPVVSTKFMVVTTQVVDTKDMISNLVWKPEWELRE